MKYDCTVVVVTYNSDLNKLYSTLLSIIKQKNISIQIVISDYGSFNFEKESLEKWFEKNSVLDYKIVTSEINTGTVKNVIRGVKAADAEIVKSISPGDLLYDEYVLYKIVSFMKKENLKLAFGKGAYYSQEDDNIRLYDFCNPKDLEPYKAKNKLKIQKNYLLYRDYVLGALFVTNKMLLLNYLAKIDGLVKYAEDCSVIMMIADGIEIGFLDEFLIWYEYGSGISTNGSKVWAERIRNDNNNCFKLLYNAGGPYKDVFAWHLGNRSLKTFWYKLQCKLHNKKVSLRKTNYIQEMDIEKLRKQLEV